MFWCWQIFLLVKPQSQVSSLHQWKCKSGWFLYHQKLFSVAFVRIHITKFTLRSNSAFQAGCITLTWKSWVSSIWGFLTPESFFPSCSLYRRDSRKEILFVRLEVQFYCSPLSCFSSSIQKHLKNSCCPNVLSYGYALTCATWYFECHVCYYG